ncbi:hypothetical protein KFK09_027489 [Dendrobium nobile]|uniref:Uncharacterized protein n=1 Tax=Dendrobium nobile TaxID=94219 RepID=A0A8T3AAW2_DENNO|nr:hypothetical protein KFK09_027489 [Dendrobium nobile]
MGWWKTRLGKVGLVRVMHCIRSPPPRKNPQFHCGCCPFHQVACMNVGDIEGRRSVDVRWQLHDVGVVIYAFYNWNWPNFMWAELGVLPPQGIAPFGAVP